VSAIAATPATAAAAAAAVIATAGSTGRPPSTAAEHETQLVAYYQKMRPDNVANVPSLFKKHGEAIWAALEKKTPGSTAEFVKVSVALRSMY
jgi:hypothetical protein